MKTNINGSYGLFIYDKDTDTCFYQAYFYHKANAIKTAKKTDTDNHSYVEVWKQDKNGTWGNSGNPIWKSDN